MLDFDALDHAGFMREALKEALAAGEAGDLPIGAVVVHGDRVVSRGRNRIRNGPDKLQHAEVEAIRALTAARPGRPEDCVVYTTTEPCVMCLGTIVLADIRSVVFAVEDRPRGGADMLRAVPYVRRHIDRYVGGVLAEASADLWRRFAPERYPFD